MRSFRGLEDVQREAKDKVVNDLKFGLNERGADHGEAVVDSEPFGDFEGEFEGEVDVKEVGETEVGGDAGVEGEHHAALEGVEDALVEELAMDHGFDLNAGLDVVADAGGFDDGGGGGIIFEADAFLGPELKGTCTDLEIDVEEGFFVGEEDEAEGLFEEERGEGFGEVERFLALGGLVGGGAIEFFDRDRSIGFFDEVAFKEGGIGAEGGEKA